VRVNDDAIGNGKQQDMVWAAYNEQGAIATVWRDRRNDASTGFWNVGYDFYYALSNDNGQTFSTNQKMSSQFIPFDSVVAENGNDFLSAVYSADTLYTVWGDTRSGRLNIWFAKTIASTNTTVDVSILNDGNEIFQVFPNPTKQTLNINFSTAPMAIDIYDLHGKRVMQVGSKSNRTNIDISALQVGIYLVKCGAYIKKIIVE
jgi:hypothetical protein